MGLNLTDTNRDYSIFLPSISSFYAKTLHNHERIKNSPRGELPANLSNFDMFDFLNEDEGVFTYKYALYSAGHSSLNLDKTRELEGMVANRRRDNTFILGDSGGFQIAKGIIQYDFNDFEGDASNKVRTDILNWLENMADYAMILDIPTWAIGKQPNIDSFRSCLEATMFNNEFFIKNRQYKTKFLNVLQGRTISESDIWFNEVKDLPFEGWAFGGANMMDFEMILSRLITMRDGHYFEENSEGNKRTWLHFLGQSRLSASVAFTHLQRLLRKQVDDNIRISYDSASAFITTAHGQVFTNDTFEKKRFGYLMEKMHDSKKLVGSELPFPWRSEVGDRITMGDICVKDDAWYKSVGKESKTSWDSFSYFLLMAHNVERQIRALQTANRIYDLSDYNAYPFMPLELFQFKEVVEDVFESETPFDEIKKHHKLLNKLVGRNTGKGVSLSTDILADMFDVEEIVLDEFEDPNDEMLMKLENEK